MQRLGKVALGDAVVVSENVQACRLTRVHGPIDQLPDHELPVQAQRAAEGAEHRGRRLVEVSQLGGQARGVCAVSAGRVHGVRLLRRVTDAGED